ATRFQRTCHFRKVDARGSLRRRRGGEDVDAARRIRRPRELVGSVLARPPPGAAGLGGGACKQALERDLSPRAGSRAADRPDRPRGRGRIRVSACRLDVKRLREFLPAVLETSAESPERNQDWVLAFWEETVGEAVAARTRPTLLQG